MLLETKQTRPLERLIKYGRGLNYKINNLRWALINKQKSNKNLHRKEYSKFKKTVIPVDFDGKAWQKKLQRKPFR